MAFVVQKCKNAKLTKPFVSKSRSNDRVYMNCKCLACRHGGSVLRYPKFKGTKLAPGEYYTGSAALAVWQLCRAMAALRCELKMGMQAQT